MNDLLIKRLNAALEQGGCTVQIGYATVEEAATEIERLQAIVARLPKTADDVPMVPGMTLWNHYNGKVSRIPCLDFISSNAPTRCCWDGKYYSTREAAEKAAGEEE
jgi:hypothetical protein